MEKFRGFKKLAAVLCALMVFTSIFNGNISVVKADGGSISVTVGTGGKLDWEISPDNKGQIEGTGTITIPQGTSTITLKVLLPPGKQIDFENSNFGDLGIDSGITGDNGKYIDISDSGNYTISIVFKDDSSGSNPGGGTGNQGQRTYPINFAYDSGATINGNVITYTVGEATVTLTSSTALTDGQATYTDSTEITVGSGFDPETMEVYLAEAKENPFSTTLAVNNGKTSIAQKTNDGGIPDGTLVIGVRQKRSEGNGDGNGQNPPTGPQNPKEITVNLSGTANLIENCKVDGYQLQNGKVSVEADNTNRTFGFQVSFGAAISKVIINGTEITSIPSEDADHYVNIPFPKMDGAEVYNISFERGESDDITIVWAYDRNTAIQNYGGADAYVEHGKVEIVSLNGNTNFDRNGINNNGGYLAFKKGDNLVIKLIPDYGYQLQSVSVNGSDMTPQESVSTFKLENIQGNLHFSGVFIPSSDTVSGSTSQVTGATISNGANAVSTGNLNLAITQGSSEDITSAVSGTNVTQVGSVDLTLTNVVSKGNGSNWTNTITEFTNPITLSLDVPASGLADGETYSVVRKHGSEVEELSATYNKSTGKLTFGTNKFSTYTIVKKAGTPESNPSNNEASGSGNESSNNETDFEKNKVTESDSQYAVIVEQELKQELKPVETTVAIEDMKLPQEVKTVLTAITKETKVPGTNRGAAPVVETMDISSMRTDKGFSNAMVKSAEQFEKSNCDVGAVYTGGWVFMNKDTAKAWEKCDIDIVWIFEHKGHTYKVTIPKGTDLSKLLDKDGFAGPLYIGNLLGTSEMVH